VIRFGTILILLCLATFAAPAQSGSAEKLRLALTYERAGDLRSAARLYQEVLDARPDDRSAFDGVVRTLSGLGQHAALLPLVEQRDRTAPSDEVAMLLGALYWKAGRTKDAETTWQRAVTMAGDDAMAWMRLAEAQSSVLAHAPAITSYRTARDRSDDPNAFAAELAGLYIVVGDITNGAVEVLRDYDASNDQLRAQGRLAAIMSTPEGVTYVGTLLQTDPASTDRSRLRQWYYRETKAWTKALEVTRDLDKRSRANGQELIAFGDGARRDGHYDVALAAYDDVMSIAANESTRLTAVYAYARTLDLKLRAGGAFSDAEARKIVERYDGIVKSYPTHWYAASALYQMALLEVDVLGDVDAARGHLQRLVSQYNGTAAAADGALRLARLYIAQEQFDAADKLLVVLARSTVQDQQGQRDMALVLRGDLAAWRGEADSARALYTAVAARPGSVAANDALDRLLVMQVSERDSVAVDIMRRAERAAAIGRNADAAERFAEASTKATDSELRDRCRIAAAEQYIAAGRDADAMTQLDRIIPEIPETIFGDRALWLQASILVRRKETQAAIDALTTLLVQYPRSILLPDARERLRALRGDT
jgi:cellulose synthase operon protein C